LPGAKKISAGQMPSATEWNRHVDAAEFVFRNLAFGNGTPRRGTPGDTNFVSVLNNSGADRAQGELLEFTDIATGLTDLTARHLILKGGSPTLANGFGILQSPIKSGDLAGDCQIAGACVAQVNVNNASHGFARVSAANYVLQSEIVGPVRILWKPSGTGQKTCAVRLHGVEQAVIVKPNSNIAKGSSNTCTVYSNGSTTGVTITATALGAAVTSGKWCTAWLEPSSGTWYVFPWEC
jgi:hypothetical protein